MPDVPDSPQPAASRVDALARRLREDPDASRLLDALRRRAYGRDGSDELLDELIAEEARLADEGAAQLAAERPPPTTPLAPPAPDRDDDADGTDAALVPPARRRPVRPAVLAGILAAVLLLVGLGTASVTGLLGGDATTASASDSPADPEASASTDPSTPRGQAMGTPDGIRGVAVPDFSADPPVPLYDDLGEDEAAATLQALADERWESVLTEDPDAVRPDVTVQRLVDQGDWLQQHALCLRGAGVSASITGEGDDARMTIVDADPVAVYTCAVQYPVAPTGTMTGAGMTWLHGYYVDFVLPCYAAEGRPYEGEVPSIAEYTARARAGSPWTPFPTAMTSQLAETCPTTPDALR